MYWLRASRSCFRLLVTSISTSCRSSSRIMSPRYPMRCTAQQAQGKGPSQQGLLRRLAHVLPAGPCYGQCPFQDAMFCNPFSKQSIC